MTKKLYKVTCRGMHGGIGADIAYGVAFVIAENQDEAYQRVKERLDERKLGFDKERELSSVELIAEATEYPKCGHLLYA